jgi:3-oxoacyl-[acyl-carrier protein] reductase
MDVFSGKVVFVTGGSRGIGAAIVRRFVRDGAAVAFTYARARTEADALVAEIAAAGGTAHAIQADNAHDASLKAAIDAAAARFGALDVLVSNAGIMILGSVDGYALEDFDRMLAVNVRAPFVAIQAALPYLAEGGRIITIGSVVADRSAFPGSAIYSMTKGALASMVRGLAIDLAKRAITVNNIQPGPTGTDMNPVDGPHSSMVRALVPLGRFGLTDEIASFVAYIASPEASFITGASLTIDGGYTA